MLTTLTSGSVSGHSTTNLNARAIPGPGSRRNSIAPYPGSGAGTPRGVRGMSMEDLTPASDLEKGVFVVGEKAVQPQTKVVRYVWSSL